MSTPIARLYEGLTLQVLGKASAVSLAAAGTGVAFKVPGSRNAVITHCLVENFSRFATGASLPAGIVLSYGCVPTAYNDLYSAAFGKSANGLASVAVSDGGSDYVTAPAVSFTSLDAGRGAKAVSTIAAGAVTVVTVTDPGEGYTVPPTVVFTGANTTPAVATAVIGPATVAINPLVIPHPVAVARIGGGITVGWAITSAVTGAGTCDISWLGGLV